MTAHTLVALLPAARRRRPAVAVAARPLPGPPLLLSLVGLVALVSLAGALVAGAPARDLVRDPAPYLGTPLHVGMLSTLGVLLWSGAAGLALLASRADPRLRVVAGVSALCALDDAFVLHEEVWPRLSGLPEELALVPYAVLGVVLLRRLGGLEAPTRTRLALAVVVLGGSVALDLAGSPFALVHGTAEDVRNLTEELAKLTGITLWLGACWTAAARALDSAPGPD